MSQVGVMSSTREKMRERERMKENKREHDHKWLSFHTLSCPVLEQAIS